MVTWGRQFLTLPDFNDEDQDRLARLLHPILLFGIVSEALVTPALLLIGTARTQQSALITGTSLVTSVLFLLLLRRGYVRFVGFGMAFTVWGLCAFALLRMDGLRSPAVGFLVFAIIYAFLVLGRRPGLAFFALSVATLIVTDMAHDLGLLPSPDPMPDGAVLLVYVLIFSVSGWVVDVVTRSLRLSLARARAAEQQLRYKADLQALVTRLATQFVNLPPDEIDAQIQRALEAVSRFVGADGCRLVKISSDQALMSVAIEWFAPHTPTFPLPDDTSIPAPQHAWLLSRLVRMETVHIQSRDELPPEARFLRAMWEQTALQAALYVPLAAGGQLIGFMAFLATHTSPNWTEDVTQLLTVAGAMIVQALERQEAEAQRHALIAERERMAVMQEFIGHISHDIRNPLAVIGTNLYVARHVDDAARRAASLDKIELQADRIATLVDDLLMLARLDAGQVVEMERVDLKRVLEEVVAQQRPLLEEKHLVYDVLLPPALPPVSAHAGDIRRVFVNLIDNAIRYSAAGRSIRVRAAVEDTMVTVEISDTGIGIPADALPHVFDRFFRADNARTYSEHGTGLGLAIVQRIVDRHGGTIRVTSEEGRGSTFCVALPHCDLPDVKLAGF